MHNIYDAYYLRTVTNARLYIDTSPNEVEFEVRTAKRSFTDIAIIGSFGIHKILLFVHVEKEEESAGSKIIVVRDHHGSSSKYINSHSGYC